VVFFPHFDPVFLDPLVLFFEELDPAEFAEFVGNASAAMGMTVFARMIGSEPLKVMNEFVEHGDVHDELGDARILENRVDFNDGSVLNIASQGFDVPEFCFPWFSPSDHE